MKLAGVHVATGDPARLIAFYREVLGEAPSWQREDMAGWVLREVRLEVARHSAVAGPAPQPERLFFDLFVDDVDGEFRRLTGLGARSVQAPYSFADGEVRFRLATLADPDGNLFQLVSGEP